MLIYIEWIPKECLYCNKPVVAIIYKRKGFSKTHVEVCKDCAKKIWEEETNRKLP